MKFLKGLSIFVLIIFLLLIILIALLVPEQFDTHLSQVIALVGTLTALVSVVWTQYNKNIEEQNKFKQFELEKKHQISKEKYQELFSDKINVYKGLYDELLKYKKRLAEIGKEDYDIDSDGNMIYTEVTAEHVNISTLRNIFSVIEQNIFIISVDIEDIYSELFVSYQSKENEFNWLFQNEISTEGEARDVDKKLDQKFFVDHKNFIDKLFLQIENEIKEMKKKIGFI